MLKYMLQSTYLPPVIVRVGAIIVWAVRPVRAIPVIFKGANWSMYGRIRVGQSAGNYAGHSVAFQVIINLFNPHCGSWDETHIVCRGLI